MADYSNYGKRRFWCEVCKTSMPYTKQAITDHERSQKHKKNQERHLKDELRKNRQLKAQQPHQQQQQQSKQFVTQKLSTGYTAEELQQLKQQYEGNPRQEREKLNLTKFYAQKGFAEAQIAVKEQQTKVELQEQNKNNPYYNIWKLQKDDQTGKLCFYNQLSKVKQFDKPFGLKLTVHEQMLWEQSQKEQQQEGDVNDNYGPSMNFKEVYTTQIGQWEIVEQNESFFEKNKAVEKEEDDDIELTAKEREQMKKITQMENVLDKIESKQLQDKFDENEGKKIVQLTTNEIFDELLEMNNDGQITNNMKLKTDRLKSLVERDIEVSGNMQKQIFKKQDYEEGKDQGKKVFKKRVLNNKKVVKLVDDDEESN